MDHSDTFQLDEHLARLLAAYDQSVEGADSNAPTIGIHRADPLPPAPAPPPGERLIDPLSGSKPNGLSMSDVLPDRESRDSVWLPRPAITPPPSAGPHRVGRFELRRQLGKGGCGIVFLAYDPKLEREVALKIPRPEMLLSVDARRRLIREALAAAEFDHPNLVPVYETGEIGPICFIATAFCPGDTLGEWIEKQAFPVPVRQAARLIATLAEAVQHAHDRGVLHRDLKPNNIILQAMREDPNAQEPPVGSCQLRSDHFIPRVVDFGLAKLLERGGPSDTTTRQILGTPKYMAPEQAQARHDDVGPAADVYALGVIFYELLTGRAPYDGASDVEVLRQAIDGDLTQPRHLRRDIPRDLEAICLKAMNRTAEKRYRTAIDFSDDLRRFLDGKPTLARPLKWLGRAARWLRRNDQAVALTVVTTIAAALLLFGLISTYQSRIYRSDYATILLEREQRTRTDRQRDYADWVREAFLAWRAGDLKAASSSLARANQLAKAASESTDFSLGFLSSLIAAERLTLVCPAGRVTALAVSPDGAFIASGHWNGTISLWARSTGTLISSVQAHEGATAYLAFPKQGTMVSASSPTNVKSWRISASGEVSSGEKTLETIAIATSLTPYVRLGNALFVGGEDGVVRAWDSPGDDPIAPAEALGFSTKSIGVHPEGGQFLLASTDDRLLSYAGVSNQHSAPIQTGPLAALHYFGDRSGLAIALKDRTVSLAEHTATGLSELFRVQLDSGIATSSEISLDGTRLVVGDDRGIARIWSMSDRRLLSTVNLAEPLTIRKIAVSNDGRFIAAIIGERLTLWSVLDEKLLASFAADEQTIFHFTPESTRLAIGGRSSAIKIWNIYFGRDEFTLYGHVGRVTALAISPNGRTLVSGGVSGDVFFWDLRTGQESMTFHRHSNPVTAIKFAANGKFLLTSGTELAIWQSK